LWAEWEADKPAACRYDVLHYPLLTGWQPSFVDLALLE
jgi:hypothetical protein